MTPERHLRVSELFLAVCEMDAVERDAFLESAFREDPSLRIEVLDLLRHDSNGDLFRIPEPAAPFPAAPAFGDSPLPGPVRVGRYRLVRLIGRGGSGSVYEAEQERPRRRVALKLIRSGALPAAAIRRFELEADVLARLTHPGIAQVYDAGVADAGDGLQPYIAMELVDGQPLAEYVEERRLRVHQRLDLFARICDVVQYAHQNGVIHRDLKPANILIVRNSGDPKLVDFGIAQAMDAGPEATLLTQAGELLGTLIYMSPEQLAGGAARIDTRADVYALGVILYRLLAGRLPHDLRDRSLPDAIAYLREAPSPALSAADRTFAGDLSTIVAKATAADRSRRYAGAGDLASDVRRFLRNEPIAARPPSPWYVLAKYAQRRRRVVFAGAMIVASLLAGSVIATWQAVRATRAERIALQQGMVAEDRARQAEQAQKLAEEHQAAAEDVTRFLSEMLASIDPRRLGRDRLVEEMLDQAAARIDRELADQPLIRARLHQTLGATYLNLGDCRAAAPHIERAYALRAELLGADDASTIESMIGVGRLKYELGQYEEAEAFYESALRTAERTLGRHHERTLAALRSLAVARTRLGRHAEGKSLHTVALERGREAFGSPSANEWECLRAIAAIDQLARRFSSAERLRREALAVAEAVFGPMDPRTLESRLHLGEVIRRRGRLDEAETVFESGRRLAIEELGAERPLTLEFAAGLARLWIAQGRDEEGEALFRETLDAQQRVLGESHPQTLETRAQLALLLRRQDRRDEAAVAYAALRELQAAMRGEDHISVVRTDVQIAQLLQRQGRLSEAERLLRGAVETGRRTMGAGHSDTLWYAHKLAEFYRLIGAFDRAEETACAAYEQAVASRGPEMPLTLTILRGLAAVYRAQGRDDEAETMLRTAVDATLRLQGRGTKDARGAIAELAALYEEQGRAEEASDVLGMLRDPNEDSRGDDSSSGDEDPADRDLP